MSFREAKTDAATVSEALPPHLLRRVYAYIETNLGAEVSLTHLAASVGMSPFNFHRAFKKTTGTTPHQYLLEQRVLYARRLLCETQLSISDIALRAGFCNQSHFTAIFHRTTGRTPRGYRKHSV